MKTVKWESVGAWEHLYVFGAKVGECSVEWVDGPGFGHRRNVKDIWENKLYLLRNTQRAYAEVANTLEAMYLDGKPE